MQILYFPPPLSGKAKINVYAVQRYLAISRVKLMVDPLQTLESAELKLSERKHLKSLK
jgi:hypothetical protein